MGSETRFQKEKQWYVICITLDSTESDVPKKYRNQPAGARIGIDPGFYEEKYPSILFQMRYLDPESDI